MPMVEGNMPLALPGGPGLATSRPAKATAPLIKRTRAKDLAAFMDHDLGKAFHKGGKKAFGK